MKVRCINNCNWFGTIGNIYEVFDIKEKVLKEMRCSGDDFKFITYTTYTVIDDYNQKVDITSNKFLIEE